MPCGGIYPIDAEDETPQHCFSCGKEIEQKDLMFCEEWDCYLHRDCVLGFLKTPEGEIVISHGHSIVLYFEREEE